MFHISFVLRSWMLINIQCMWLGYPSVKWMINGWGLFPSKDKVFSLCHHVQPTLRLTSASYPLNTGGHFPWGKAAGSWSSIEVPSNKILSTFLLNDIIFGYSENVYSVCDIKFEDSMSLSLWYHSIVREWTS